MQTKYCSQYCKTTGDMNLSDGLVINSKYTRAEAYHGAETVGVSLIEERIQWQVMH